MIRLGGLLLVLLLVIATRLQVAGGAHAPAADATMALGFVLVISFFVGRLARRVGLPQITGYIVAGLLFGPHALSLVISELRILGHDTVSALQLLDGTALGLIALTAGGELRLSIVRKQLRVLRLVIASHVVLVVLGVGAVALPLLLYSDVLPDRSLSTAVAAALLLAVSAVAKSPATTIAIMKEYEPRGPMTDVVLAVTVAKDVVVVVVFTIGLVFAAELAMPGSGFDATVLLTLAWEVGGSLAVGVLCGWLLAGYMKRLGHEVPLVVLAIAIGSGALTADAHMSGLLICMVAGFYVENFSEHGEELIQAVERHSLPLYVIFFTIAGAALDLQALRQSWHLTVALVISRGLFTFVATLLGARWAGAPPAVRHHAWTGFIGQAGVTLGFVTLIADRVPRLADCLRTLIVSGVALNQIAGPVLFKWGLQWADEIGEAAAAAPIVEGVAAAADAPRSSS